MINFSSEAITSVVLEAIGFTGENEEVMRSPSLNCNIATLTREHPKNSRSHIKVTQIT
jgi:hypothetical protein